MPSRRDVQKSWTCFSSQTSTLMCMIMPQRQCLQIQKTNTRLAPPTSPSSLLNKPQWCPHNTSMHVMLQHSKGRIAAANDEDGNASRRRTMQEILQQKYHHGEELNTNGIHVMKTLNMHNTHVTEMILMCSATETEEDRKCHDNR